MDATWEQVGLLRVAPQDTQEITMQVKTVTDTERLMALLDEALSLADALDLPMVAIHIDQARAQLGDLSPR